MSPSKITARGYCISQYLLTSRRYVIRGELDELTDSLATLTQRGHFITKIPFRLGIIVKTNIPFERSAPFFHK